jgi:hypothetical protein
MVKICLQTVATLSTKIDCVCSCVCGTLQDDSNASLPSISLPIAAALSIEGIESHPCAPVNNVVAVNFALESRDGALVQHVCFPVVDSEQNSAVAVVRLSTRSTPKAVAYEFSVLSAPFGSKVFLVCAPFPRLFL